MARETAERETVIRIGVDGTMCAWTDDPAMAKQWRAYRWPLQTGCDRHGNARSWFALNIPSDRVIFRRLRREKPGNSTYLEGEHGQVE